MDPIIAGALQQQQELTAFKTQMSVLKTTMNVQKEMGEAIIGLIDSAAMPMQTPGKAIGLGGKFDAYA